LTALDDLSTDPTADGSDDGWAGDTAASSTGRFAGDEGTWDPRLRDAVVHLYKRRFISKAQHSQHWEPLIRNLAYVRTDLHNHNLELVVDHSREVMYKKQAPIEDDAPTLLRDVAYTLEETALLVALRAMTLDATERVVRVDRDDLLSTLTDYRPAQVADEKAKTKREEQAVQKMVQVGFLRPTNTGDGYTIDPVIEAALPYETLRSLHDTLHTAPDTDGVGDDSDDDGYGEDGLA